MEGEKTSGVRVFPPLIAAVGILLGLGLTFVMPVPIVEPPTNRILFGLGIVSVVLWLLLAATANVSFRRVRTPVNPYAPSTALAVGGPFRFSRNPMYLGLVLLVVGIALVMNSMWLVLLAVPVMLLLRNLVIVQEERYLEDKFGDDYRAYKQRVRRWL
jgi:protein-S-isoprenylcysteine O-methyltransferase Ste14